MQGIQRACSFLLLVVWVAGIAAHDAAGAPLPVQWPQALFTRPKTTAAPEAYKARGVASVFLEGPEYQGKATHIFAYYGLPANTEQAPWPGMVLVHGGGGTAFAQWVRLWNRRGYAAIAMDTCGCLPGDENGKRPRHEAGGPAGWGAFETAMEPVTEQWAYHAVSAVILAHSFLRSLPEVDPERIGLTGISWGGYLTCLMAAADPRFQFAVPVYGCGFLGENSAWSDNLKELGEPGARWLALWDPKHYLGEVRMPMLWVTGTNDFAYPMDSLQRSYRLPGSPHTLCLRLRMPHGHGGAGENPEEIHAFADHFLRGGPALPRITGQGREEDTVWVTYESPMPVAQAELLFTKDLGKWQDRQWEAVPASVDTAGRKASALLPPGAKVYYLNLTDAEGRVVSSEHEATR